MKKEKYIVIYQAKSGAIELKGDLRKETVWATQAQIALVFDIDRSVVTKHIGNILKSKEVVLKSNVQKMHIANSDKPVAFYSLDLILAVGYRANSTQAIEFRKWATKTLRSHIIDGYTLNPNRIKKNYETFMVAVEKVRSLIPRDNVIDIKDTLELVKLFASTWFSLGAYDKSSFKTGKLTKKQVLVTGTELHSAICELKTKLLSEAEASELFAQEKQKGSVEGIVGNVFQSFGGEDIYSSIEEKAAHLLYFIVKNHPFSDGNKRSGAFAFIWFLKKANILNIERITPEALTALTLLVAESDPKEKDQVVGLIVLLLSR